MRFTVRTSLLALGLTYGLHWWYFVRSPGTSEVTPPDCAAYSAGKGLDEEGNPFQVNRAPSTEDNLKKSTNLTVFQNLDAFYPYYLCEHRKPATKLVHVVATFNALSLLGRSAAGPWRWSDLALGLLQGYGLAWYSHFFIEQNKPATWQYPGYSFISDQRLFLESLMGRHRLYA